MSALSQEPYWYYSARPGDNIWSLSRRYLSDWHRWPEILRLNEITDPEAIQVGTQLLFPLAWLRLEPAEAQLVELQGAVMRVRDSIETAASVGMRLALGDVLVTGENADAVVSFADGSRVVLRSNTRLVFDRLAAYRGTGMVDTRLKLERGRLETQVEPVRGSGSRFEVWTVPATSSVRGTHLRIGVNEPAERSATEVLSGTVSVAALSTARSVTSGFGTVTQLGSVPPPPRRLLPPPSPDALPERLERLPLRLPMPLLEGADRFRLGIAEEDGFARLLVELIVDAGGAARLNLADGLYVARLRGIESDGLEGRDRVWDLEVFARPEPPAPQAPEREGRLRVPRPTFAWSEPLDAAAYDLELATTQDFADVVIRAQALAALDFTPTSDLPLGQYFWRIRTINENHRRGPWSEIESFEIIAPPDEPKLSGFENERGRLTLRLATLEPDQRLRFEIARDADFAAIIYNAIADQAEIVVPSLLPGDYWFRAQIIETDGYTAEFSTPQRITVPPVSWWPALLLPFALLLLLL